MAEEKKEELVFSGRVLDNVHGFIEYTKTEECIINTLLFKRLQSIKQLSIVNWVFPGSEHTRYIHSLGVMYIADRIAVQLKLPMKDRKIVRLAGLLHDIGHYPLSHVCELPYKNVLEAFPEENYCIENNKKVKRQIEDLNDIPTYKFMKKSQGCHHEKIGADIVLKNKMIRDLIVEECADEKAPEIIADMIIGNTERTNPLLVQILHSELDADGIDYLMRDAMFSGTSFGAFELDQLIGCMCIGELDGKQILCISPKGIAAADQYLINKFFSYSQVVCNKHVTITEWMAEQIVNWMQRNNAYFPRTEELKKWVNSELTDEKYLSFTDNFFWASLQNLLTNELAECEPDFIRLFCHHLIHHEELQFEEGSEVKIICDNNEEIKQKIMKSAYFSELEEMGDRVAVFSTRRMSKQIHFDDFQKRIEEQIAAEKRENGGESITEEQKEEYRLKLFMECICVKDGDKVGLLCDDERSLMRAIYANSLGVFRVYKYK